MGSSGGMEHLLEIAIRVGFFAAIFAAMALWELVCPARALMAGRSRWPANLGIFVIDILTVRLVSPTAVVGAAVTTSSLGWGLFNLAGIPGWIAGGAGFLILDLVIYTQHYIFHHVPWLWRLHRVHHADLDVDLTTGVRFHPLEILISLGIKIATVAAFGIPPIAVLIFEIVLNVTSIFNHANVMMPAWLDRMMRLVVVTPDMHRVHHSIERGETDSNFGFNLPWWDRLFGTYCAQPRAGHRRMTVGLPIFRDLSEMRIDRLLTQPFRRK
jgi:sterol desaturase/sphingolipid hydroxylase (fatty acid hydroxylase superfamily)